jgi:ribosomal protein S18 acetylase RimI-like enzyme
MAIQTPRDGADLVVRPMTRPELDVAVEWAADEGWNPRLKDADCFHRTDPDGFLMGFRDGEPVASISVVRYDGAFGFLGFYIVRPKFRGLGYGWRIWQDGMKRLSGRTIGLDGVVAQQANYAKSGFVLAHRSVRYAGDVQVEPRSDPRLETIGSDLVPGVIAYDRPFFPTGREGFLQCWLAPDCRKAVALLEDGEIEGYGVIRACRTGHKIGPLFARSEADADVLFRALAAVVQGGPIFLDVPEPNRAAVKLGGRYGFRPVFETARMYRGPEPTLPLDRIYGITTFELG